MKEENRSQDHPGPLLRVSSHRGPAHEYLGVLLKSRNMKWITPWKAESESICEPSPVWCKEGWGITEALEDTEQLRTDRMQST